MKYIPRALSKELKRAADSMPALILSGPRQSGKTTLLRHLFPEAQYILLEDPDWVDRIRTDPRGFLEEISLPVILDEIQNTPELFNYIRTRIDAEPSEKGRWLLTGSQEVPLMRGVTESMAGRTAVFQLLPFSCEESKKVSPLSGGYPDILNQPSAADIWFRSYIQTYLERDIRSMSAIRDLSVFRRFMALLASRSGQMLNKTDIAAPLGVSVPTVTQWISMLEISGQVVLVPPFYENFGKRLVKTPKLYFTDSGLLCHLLGIHDQATLRSSPFRGAVHESFAASEILKFRQNRGMDRNLYYFRDRQGLEVDFLLDRGNNEILLLEVKATQTPRPGDAAPMRALMKNMKQKNVSAWLAHTGGASGSSVLAPGIKTVDINQLASIL